jgi:NAD(P)-dependent dehydrogenase (short-subunit alcohol dehydrogenase family)
VTTALITGANRGIGLELCRLLAARGDRVIGVCRRSSPDLDALGARVEAGVELTSDDDVRGLAERLDGERIDLVINNAGVLSRVDLDDLDFDEIRRLFEINSLAPLRVTAALLPLMNEGGKIAIITSRMGSIDDNSSGGSYAYRMSKGAVNMAGASLAVDLRPRRISVAILHPGFVRTGMTKHRGNVEPSEAAAGLLAHIDELTLDTSGGFWHASGERLPW